MQATQARPPRLRTPFARAVVPVLAGIAFLVLIALILWGVAAYISRDDVDTSDRLTPTTFRVASVESAAAEVAESGPILFPGLNTTTGERTIVLHHEGDDPDTGWRVYFAYPAGEAASCAVTQVQGTREFVDCNGVTIDVTALAPPDRGINPVIEDGILSIDLTSDSTGD